MNGGLLLGLAEGLKSGVESYRTERSYYDKKRQEAQEAELRKRMAEQAQSNADRSYRAETFSKGIIDQDGVLSYSPEAVEERTLKKRRVEAEINKDNADAEYKRRERKGLLNGKQLPPDKVLAVNESNTIPKMLNAVRSSIENNVDLFGPVQGRLGSMNPYNVQAQTIDAEMRTASQTFGRYMEGGVLRKEDEDKYRRMFPQLHDTPEVAKNKLAIVDRLLAEKRNSDVAALRESGWDVSGLGNNLPVPDSPGLLSIKQPGDSGGLINSAHAGGLPAVGEIQMGFRFKGGDPSNPKSWEPVK